MESNGLYRWVVSAFIALLFLSAGCTGCQDELLITSEQCPDEECVSCEDHDDCDGATYCGEVDGESVCVIQECTPGESFCEGDDVLLRCDDIGSGVDSEVTCESGVCQDGQCGCDGNDDCAVGEDCENGLCQCPSDVHCGDDGACCGDGEICGNAEICDDGECEEMAMCRPECEGSFCGVGGDICCEGDTPNCGPGGECAPDCSDQGELCGDDFDMCCNVGDVCVFGGCRTPGEPCQNFTDCEFGEYCDAGLERCMPDDFPDDISCTQEGDFQDMEITEKWSWTDEDIISIPVVGDVTGDGEPNVVINTSRIDGSSWNWEMGDIVILDSAGVELERVEHDPDNDSWGSQGRSNIALADVTGDGVMEIIYASRVVTDWRSYIVAIDGDGDKVWRARDEQGDLVTGSVYNGGITVANFDGDSSRAELVAGAMLIDSDGLVVWNQDGDGPLYGTNAGYQGGVAVVADLNGDGNHEIVTGRNAWTVDWQPAADPDDPPQVVVDEYWVHDGPDGYPAVADMDGNGDPEVILVADQSVSILEGTTGELWCGVDATGQDCDDDDSLRTAPAYLPGPSTNNRGGPPTVADFDGDGRPEIGVAGGHYYTVFDVNRPEFGGDGQPEEIDQDLLDEIDASEPDLGEIFVRWQKETRDLSSNTTGSSVFDFQGDGSASVIYADECFMRVYSGIDGEVELEIMNSTGTILEYPLVVDVDENGRSEILVVANDIDHCSGFVDGYQTRQGIFVYEDPNDLWVRTRSIWNQHAYSIDNILDDGSVPDVQEESWNTHNTFRANRQGEVPLNAADPVVTSLQIDAQSCPADLFFQATVANMGMAAIPEGMPVSLYRSGESTPIETIYLDRPISPGSMTIVEFEYEVTTSEINADLAFQVVANDDGDGGSPVVDCSPDDATSEVVEVICHYAI